MTFSSNVCPSSFSISFSLYVMYIFRILASVTPFNRIWPLFVPHAFSSLSNTPTKQKWSLLHPWSHSAATKYLVPLKICALFIFSTRHYAIALTSSRHHHDIIKTSSLHPDASPIFVCRTRRITDHHDHRRFSKYIVDLMLIWRYCWSRL